MSETKKIWDGVLGEIELQVSKANFNTWFRDTFISKIDDGVVHVAVPNAFVRDWLLNKYHKCILKSLRDSGKDIRSVEYNISKSDSKKQEAEVVRKISPTNELPLQDFYINKEDNLNPRYTFESFIVGPFNELAHAASQAVLKKPGISYNPLFIYGDTGRGKTHLIQSVGNYLKNNGSNSKVIYVTSEKFVVDYVNAVQGGKMNFFKEKYRKYDVFIMDDTQFLSGKEKCQEELFHLFNTFYDNNKQIIFSSDRHPNYIDNLEERLKSRFAAGMIVDISAPDHESRMAILKTKAKVNNVFVDDQILDFIASNIEGNIRELEGIFNSIVMQTQLKQRTLNLIEVKNLIKDSSKPKKSLSVKEIVKIVSDYYNVEENFIYEKTRKKEIVKPRQIIMYLLREDMNISYPSIGEKLGGRDHTTVIHSCEKIKEDIKTNNLLSQELSHIRSLMF
ncbi:MAG TPA: chromosomal replication initiator protein DnaA [Candidatus Paceibacterota bacterium]|nr:chromosomal replication initiator protein DnaA [Candidatus Paceibacterota bacterium]